MKLLRLRFKNLNSLAGVWDIDFRHPDYVSSGIFAITGPTGAGKTTILDAVCLALYGQTPRLNRITQGENEIMSRQTGECFAEVEFATAKGCFRCHWGQHRSRKQAGGQLQSPRHEIAEAESGIILESKLKAVIDKVEEVTGMDFDRFTRSMLLAQGGFAAFLQATPDRRAPILEQITGTAIYSRISIKVHERTAEERKRLAELRAELDGIELLSSVEAEALRRERAERLEAEGVLTAHARIIHQALSWRERIAALEGELLQLDQDQQDFAARKASAQPELARLALAGRALKLGGDHAHLLSIRTQQAGEQAERQAAGDRLPLVQREWQTAFEALEQAEAGLRRALAAQSAEAELIRVTRALDVRIGEAQAQRQGLMAAIDKTQQRIGDHRQAIKESDQRINQCDAELQGVAAFLEGHQADAGLAVALTGIEQQLKAFKALSRQCRVTQDKLGRHANLVERAALTRRQAESAWQGARQAVTEAETRLGEVRAARDTLLAGRDLAAWREATEVLAIRGRRLETILEALARMEEARPKLTALAERGEALARQRLSLVRQEETLALECELREQVARQARETVVLLNRVRSLEDDRRQLADGAPCPLCGACDHPYAAGNVPELDQAQEGLELALAEAKRVWEQLTRSRLEQVAVDKDLHQAGVDRTELQGRQQRDEDFCRNGFVELGLSADAGGEAEVIRRESEVCREELGRQRGLIREAEGHEQAERSAQTALDKLKDQLAAHDKARLTARLAEEGALAEGARLKAESAALTSDLDRTRAEVEVAVAEYGPRNPDQSSPSMMPPHPLGEGRGAGPKAMELDPDQADALLAALTARRNAYVEQVRARERLEKGRADLAGEREKQQALLAELEKALAEKELQLREGAAQREALVEQRLERYGERNPDLEEKRLAEAVRQAGELREAALRGQNRLQAELAGLRQQLARLTVSIARRGEELAGLEAAFGSRLLESGFADEPAFQQACLPRERFDALTQWADTLRQDETALLTRRQDRQESLARELHKGLTDKPLEQIREEHLAITEKLKELQQAVGALDQKLRRHAEQQERHQARLRAIELQRRECDRWEGLHALIGSSDGKRFRNFAQGLTFELMVAHANRQLRKMSDRYILVRDNTEPLELNVIDNYQAGEIRSTKNLSGGESFIASLALSLGLSHMASRNVRVDSLFLDEGFGTLDEDALETALETLSGLQQDGKLIGIISHVPALKERIGTQIQVEAGSAGRGSLSGPGCRRVS